MIGTCLQKMGQQKLRITRNRRLLLEVLHEALAPLSPPALVAELHRRGRKVNKTTVYRDLELLETVELVKRVIVSDRRQYFELTERGHHHHLVCARCGTIEDILFPRETQLLVQGQRLAAERGFSVLRHSMEFFGICKHCA